MPVHHPSAELLVEYSGGILPVAQSACVAAHLHYCSDCRRQTRQLDDIGAALLERLEPAAVSSRLLNDTLGRLEEEPPLKHREPGPGRDTIPAILQRLMSGDFSDLNWKKLTAATRITRVITGDRSHEFALLHISAGGRIPEHTHRGSEMTLVLQGGFSDAGGSYHPGDFIFLGEQDVHAPTALQSEDCIVLTVMDAPLRFTRWKYRWMNPFLRLHPL